MKRRVMSVAVTLVAALMAVPGTSLAQGPPDGLPPQAQAEVHLPVKFDVSPGNLRDLPEPAVVGRPRGGRDFEPGKPFAAGPAANAADPLAANGLGASAAVPLPKVFEVGTGIDPNARVAPPDTTGDLGPNHYVQWVNLRYAIYNVVRNADNSIADFTLVSGFPKNGNTVWAGFGGACETSNDGDPIVQYDQAADRWILTQFAVSSSPYLQCIAVSQTGDPTGGYYRYAYSFGTDFNDYPKMGVWSDGYYITYNIFRRGRTFGGSRVCGYERDKMLVGASARSVCATTSTSYGSLLPADVEGATAPPAGAPNYLLSISSSAMQFWRFKVNWGTKASGTLTGPFAVPVAAFTRACGGGTCIPQAGTSRTLDSLADRLMYRLSYRNFGTREVLVVNHSVTAGSSAGVRWYEIRNAANQSLATAAPVVFQQGTYAPDAAYRWMGSAAMDKAGNIAIGYNVSSATLQPGIRYTSRAAGDTPGTMGPEQVVSLGPTGSQTGTLSRWGDYSMLSVDPVDGCTMVFTGEYIPSNGSFNWATAITSFKLSTCQ